MEDTNALYAAADLAGRQELLLERIREHRFNPSLNRLIALESPDFIAAIAIPLWEEYPYFFNTVLCLVADRYDLSRVATILRLCNFADHIPPIDLSRVSLYCLAYGNPLSEFYHDCGPQSFVALYEAGAVSLSQLYFWVRSQSVSPHPDYEEFILALANCYANDPVRASSTLTECLMLEYDIATSRGYIFYLEDELQLFNQILSRLGTDNFCAFLTYLSIQLKQRPARTVAENLIYIEFLKYVSLSHIPIDGSEAFHLRYWSWLLDNAAKLTDVRDFLLMAIANG